MRNRLAVLRALGGAALLGLALLGVAPSAVAEESYGTFEVSPNVVTQGQEVTITATCDYPELATMPLPIASFTLQGSGLTGERGEDGVWRLSGKAHVAANAPLGKGSAHIACGPPGNLTFADFQVAASDPPYTSLSIGQNGTVSPGERIFVLGYCWNPEFIESEVTSSVLTVDFPLTRALDAPVESGMSVSATVDADAEPGTYTASFTCVEGKPHTVEFIVDSAASGSPTSTGVTTSPKAQPQVPVKPRGGADTGAAASAGGDGGAFPLVGGALVLLTAAGAGVWAHRRGRDA
ncbi:MULTISPECIES: hypothetical protein [Actinosynnema]|uniref:hypothetical protein n=1 Tax=Actinosynnema TaxID=40566 RepID=UPI0020A3BD10|nr:hypothetical protein [Actinosynnema pretiosum]MCP2099390.1 hypothetical protein [Actinosynnema pretiosum]